MLRRYDTLIIDEAHERSLNIDFLLGYLRQLLPQRPDLKVIITSATIDTERFARALRRRRRRRPAPIVKVTGRTYPVEMRYRPFGDEPERRPRPGAGDRRRRRGAGPGRARRRARVPQRRAGDPRHRRRTCGAARPAATPRCCRCTPGCRRAEQHRIFQPHTRPADRAGHQRRRDVAHRARGALRRRRRHGPHLPLQPPAEGAATADRADLAGLGQPAGRALRTRRAGHLHPAVRRGRLRRPPGVHRAGDPAHQPGVGHPADDGDRARRRRRVPVRRAARPRPRSATATSCWRSSVRSSPPTTTALAG